MKYVASFADRVLPWLTCVLMIIALAFVFLYVPNERIQGPAQRIFYFHLPAAWNTFLGFFVVAGASAAFLWQGDRFSDLLAQASAEVGMVFCTLVIITGSIWARPIWGVWWTWDPRLTTTAVLLLIYIGYLAVRRITDNPSRRATWAAVVGIVGFIDVPIVHLSVVWWRSLHQGSTVFRLGGPEIEGTMLVALLVGVAAFTVTYAYLMTLRLRVGRLEERAAREALSPLVGAER